MLALASGSQEAVLEHYVVLPVYRYTGGGRRWGCRCGGGGAVPLGVSRGSQPAFSHTGGQNAVTHTGGEQAGLQVRRTAGRHRQQGGGLRAARSPVQPLGTLPTRLRRWCPLSGRDAWLRLVLRPYLR